MANIQITPEEVNSLLSKAKNWITAQEGHASGGRLPPGLTQDHINALRALQGIQKPEIFESREPSLEGENWVGKLNEYHQKNTSDLSPIFTEAVVMSANQLRFRYSVIIAEHQHRAFPREEDYPNGTNEAPTFTKKKDAKQWAAKCAVEWLQSRNHNKHELSPASPRKEKQAKVQKIEQPGVNQPILATQKIAQLPQPHSTQSPHPNPIQAQPHSIQSPPIQPPQPHSTQSPQPHSTQSSQPNPIQLPQPHSTQSPQPNPIQSPQPHSTQSPRPSFTQSPQQSFTRSPQHNSTQSPQPHSTQSLQPNFTKSPQHNSTQSPQHNSTQSPQLNSTQSPQLNSTQSPQLNSTQSPQHIFTQSPQPNSTQSLPLFSSSEMTRDGPPEEQQSKINSGSWWAQPSTPPQSNPSTPTKRNHAPLHKSVSSPSAIGPSDLDPNNTPQRQVDTTCKRLGLPPPRYVIYSPPDSDLFHGFASWPTEPTLPARAALVSDIITKKGCKESIAEKLLITLKEIELDRERTAARVLGESKA